MHVRTGIGTTQPLSTPRAIHFATSAPSSANRSLFGKGTPPPLRHSEGNEKRNRPRSETWQPLYSFVQRPIIDREQRHPITAIFLRCNLCVLRRNTGEIRYRFSPIISSIERKRVFECVFNATAFLRGNSAWNGFQSQFPATSKLSQY